MRTIDVRLLAITLIATAGLSALVALTAARRCKNKHDYFLAGRQLGWLPLAFTLVATQLGAGMILGGSEEAFAAGVTGLFYSAGMALGFVVLGCGVAAKLQDLGICTTAELFETRYGSRQLRLLASLLSVITLGGLLTGQVVASMQILGPIAGEWTTGLLAVLWVVLIAYTMFGGLSAVVATDVLQVGVIVVVLLAVFGMCLLNSADPLPPNAWLSTRAGDTPAVPWHRWQSLLLMPACYSLIEQDLAQRFFAGKSKRAAVISTFVAAVVLLCLALLPAYFGLKARALVPLSTPLPDGANPLLVLVDSLGSRLLTAMTLCALLAAISSTADSLLCAIASNVVYDFGRAGKTRLSQNVASAGTARQKLPRKRNLCGINEHSETIFNEGGASGVVLRQPEMWVSRAVTVVVGITALGLAPYAGGILQVMVMSYTLSVSCLFVPLMACLVKQRVYAQAAFTSCVLGLGGFLWALAHAPEGESPEALFALALSLLGYVVADRWMRLSHRAIINP
ncbi:MAG: sodium:solute symporter family protein [Myxococcota bacterium]